MQIIVKNCNSIDEAYIRIDEGTINIKYAMNGTGKSTIAKAIELSILKKDELKNLLPFKNHDKKDDANYCPSIHGAEKLSSVKVFNEEYIKQFTFKQDEVVENSFEIFIKTPEYIEGMKEIEESFKEIKYAFEANENIDAVITDLEELSNSFGKSSSGYSKSGAIHKGIGNGNKLENIPESVISYKNYLQSSANVKWLKWQIGGKEFLDISNECPYCVSPTTEEKKESIKSIEKEYDSKAIEHLNSILRILNSLSLYFSDDTNYKFKILTTNKSSISEEEVQFLIEVKSHIDILRKKLHSLKSISFFSFKDVDKVIDVLKDYKIKIEFITHLNSPKTNEIVGKINDALDQLIQKATEIQKNIGIHKCNIKNTIKIYSKQINSFLLYAGYKYTVDIEDDNEQYRMKLKHTDSPSSLKNGDQYLSYGERNAFSLVLFMYDTIRSNPDLIILDDPISSFDRNKKYAILDTLFRGNISLKNRTVLLLTHDFEPVIDMIYTLSTKFPNAKAAFLELNNGKINEIDIKKSDIITFNEVCKSNLDDDCDDIIKLIYLRRRYEALGEKGCAYQLISNILHKREQFLWVDHTGERNMSDQEISDATLAIKEFIGNFNHSIFFARVTKDIDLISVYKNAKNNYEKLQLFRIIHIDSKIHESDIIAKFIKETFHIENEYLMQLNPNKYQTTPTYIIKECDKLLGL